MADGHQIALDDKVDRELTAKVMEISVDQSVDAPTRFRVKFAIDICNGKLTHVDDPRLTPGTPDRLLSVYSTVRDERVCLVRGIITKRKMSLTHGGPGSWMEVHGQDRTLVMTRKITPATFSGSAGEIARGILSRHKLPFEDRNVDAGGTDYRQLNQTKNDFEFLTRLASNNKASLWIEYAMDSAGRVSESVHFRQSPKREKGGKLPTKLKPDTEVVLLMNTRDDCVNMTTFEVEADNEVPTASGPLQRVNGDRLEIEEALAEPSVEYLGSNRPKGSVQNRLPTAGEASEAYESNQSALNDASWAIKARAETSAHALKHIVRPHTVIQVRGTGSVDDGPYFVRAVSHTLDATAHKMSIELARNALGGA